MVRRRLRNLPLLATALALNLAGCATTEQWGVTGGNREHGVVQVSYDYPEFHQPAVEDEQALKIAESRCNSWGYDAVEPIEGQRRQCSNMNGSNCDLWTVTREYQCTSNTAFARILSK